MRMLKAIARVRRGALDSGLEGALSSLENELRSDAIPSLLRDAAARLATFISPKAAATPVVALEQALTEREHKAAADALHHQAHAGAAADPHHVLAHGGAGVCPFTGMRADGTLAVPPSTLASANDPTLELSTAQSAEPGELAVEVRAPAAEAAVEAPAPVPAARKPKIEGRSPAREPKVEAAVRAPKARAKDKEKLAGARVVENTSARSATRSGSKQPRSRTQRSRKKA